MQVAFETNPREFLEKYGPALERSEAEHNLILTLCQIGQQRIKAGEKYDIRIATQTNEEGLAIAAVQTPPSNLVLSRGVNADIDQLVDALIAQNFTFPGIVGPSDVAASFANKWMEKTGQKSVEFMDHVIYSINRVIFPPAIDGFMRPAKESEAKTICQWMMSFAQDALPRAEQLSLADATRRTADLIKAKRVYVWDVGGTARAQAAFSGTSAAARLNMVYTPPEERGHGYASAVVANLSQYQLENGKKMCCLYADARNPVSNSIYRKIGYQFVGRSSLYVLEKQEAAN